MIDRIIIDNYALIEHLNLELTEGLTIITGETGSGKSIMLDAIGLLMGERADSKAIADKTKKTVVEAHFSRIPSAVKKIFKKHSLEWSDEELIVRREIAPSGRSRAFVNDSPVNLQILSEITIHLIDIHSQHNNLVLRNPDNHLLILDDFIGNDDLLKEYKQLFVKYVTLRQKIRKIKNDIEKQKEKRDFIVFRFEQLDKIKPKAGELEKIEREFDLLSDADQIRNDLGEACSILNETEGSVLESLSSVESLLGGTELSLISDDEEDIMERLNNVKIEIRDIYENLSGCLERVESDPARMSRLSARMNILYDAIKRFKVRDENELVGLYEELKESLENMETGDEDIESMVKESKTMAANIKELAAKLTELRKKSAIGFSHLLKQRALPLGLPNLEIEVGFEQIKLTQEGQDKVIINCSFNKNHPLQPINSVASGGEMSRLMLSLKSVLSGKKNLPTIIFDEIDTGVSGEIADKMGEMMKKMSEEMQVIVITHLPQVAAKGTTHFKVYKKDNDEKTISYIEPLDREGRLMEIASMLSGSKVNKEALANARVLLQQS